jgi:hypothetical protein
MRVYVNRNAFIAVTPKFKFKKSKLRAFPFWWYDKHAPLL